MGYYRHYLVISRLEHTATPEVAIASSWKGVIRFKVCILCSAHGGLF